MMKNAIDAARDFAQYLVNEGKLGVTREVRYIGSERLHLAHYFLLANEYKIKFGGLNVHERDDSAWPSVDKAVGWGLWHLLDELHVKPTTTQIDPDTDEAYRDFWMPLPVSRQVRGTGAVTAAAPMALATAAHDPGKALPGAVRRRYEAALGTDLSQIRLHTDAPAAVAAKAIDARAYTVGRDIYFDSGEFSPGTPAGDRLLAHELAHAAWAPSASRRRYGYEIVPASAASERAAEATAERVTAAQANAAT
jgi:hypothetical protein